VTGYRYRGTGGVVKSSRNDVSWPKEYLKYSPQKYARGSIHDYSGDQLSDIEQTDSKVRPIDMSGDTKCSSTRPTDTGVI